jgi:hypothetical protein
MSPLQNYYDKLKTEHGGFAVIVWVIVSAFLFYTEPAARLFSWQALVYFCAGMIVVPLVLGGLSYLLVRSVSHALVRAQIVTEPNTRTAAWLTAVGCLIFVAQALLIYFVARWTIRIMF